jgi:hypothetical protein
LFVAFGDEDRLDFVARAMRVVGAFSCFALKQAGMPAFQSVDETPGCRSLFVLRTHAGKDACVPVR